MEANAAEIWKSALESARAQALAAMPQHAATIERGMGLISVGKATLEANDVAVIEEDGSIVNIGEESCRCPASFRAQGHCVHNITRRLLLVARKAAREYGKKPSTEQAQPGPQPRWTYAAETGRRNTMVHPMDVDGALAALDKRYHRYLCNIQGRPYLAVDGRVAMAVDEHRALGAALTIDTSFIEIAGQWLCRAYVTSAAHGSAMGHAVVPHGATSGAEKTNPFEVAETSAVGRALGFMGYGLFGGGIAPGDDIQNSEV